MLSVEECKKHLKDINLSDERIKDIRDYLYALSRETIKNNIDTYEASVRRKSQ